MKTKVLVVAGPTASGKTGLGIALARRLDGEIVCADSMQIYTGMPIATAAPTAAERQAAVHHLAEILPPDTPFSVAQYCKLAAETVADIAAGVRCPFWLAAPGCLLTALLTTFSSPMCRQTRTCAGELAGKGRHSVVPYLAAGGSHGCGRNTSE